MRSGTLFFLIALAVAAVVFGCARAINNDYVFFAGYTVLQFIVLATAWNILGGYTGYVNFGSAAFFALGAYSSVFFHKLYPMPVPVLIVIAAVISGLVGLGMGYLTLRLRGAFFSIATLALAVVLQTLVVNWNYVGGARGAYVIRPAEVPELSLPYRPYHRHVRRLYLTPGEVVKVEVEIWPTSMVFKRGHRIRVDLSSSNFPRFDVNPNTGEPLNENRGRIVATNTIHHDADHPSHIVLPIVPR